jgi:hypothetical protein
MRSRRLPGSDVLELFSDFLNQSQLRSITGTHHGGLNRKKHFRQQSLIQRQSTSSRDLPFFVDNAVLDLIHLNILDSIFSINCSNPPRSWMRCGLKIQLLQKQDQILPGKPLIEG